MKTAMNHTEYMRLWRSPNWQRQREHTPRPELAHLSSRSKEYKKAYRELRKQNGILAG